MSDLGIVMFMPTRGRPEKALEAYEAAFGDPRVRIIPVLDAEDPAWHKYIKAFRGSGVAFMAGTGNMVQRTNEAVKGWLDSVWNNATVVGWMADDTIWRDSDWVSRVLIHFLRDDALILSVNDGHLDRERPQSAILIRSDAVKALGYLVLPSQIHLYIDNAWADLRDGVGGRYGHHDSTILAEHMHPYVGKGEWDQQYLDIHKPEKYVPDLGSYIEWKESGGLDSDIGKMLSCVKS